MDISRWTALGAVVATGLFSLALTENIWAMPSEGEQAAKSSAAGPSMAATIRVPAGAEEPVLTGDARPKPERIATSVFAARPFTTNLVLSPDGTHFAARTQVQGKEVLAIFDFSQMNAARLIPTEDKWDLISYFWAGNSRLLVDFGRTVPWYDDEAYSTRLIVIDIVTGKGQWIGGKTEGLKGDDVLWVDPEGKTILIAYQKTIYDYPSVFSVDLSNNKNTEVVKQRTDIWDWYADNKGVVRYAYGWPDDHHWQMIYRKDANEPFKVVAKGSDKDSDDEDTLHEDKAFSLIDGSDEGFKYGVSKLNGLKGVYRYNYATHQYGDLVFEAPDADIDDAVLSEDGKNLLAAWWTDSRERIKWFEPAREQFQTDVDKAVGERQAWVVSRSRDSSRMIVWVGASNDPGTYYFYQEATGRMSPLAKLAENLNKANLAKSQYVHYTARDGTEIPAYLTLPMGREANGLPLIIMPHGGPYGVRDDGGYSDDVQFLANRGYAVLQPQYRGSGSYGKGFDKLGEGQWGRAMQDDIDDGMDWLVKLGVADASRVCIVGASYGGYAALWGATRNPERYRCAVSFAGISDMPRQLKYQISGDSKQAREKWRARVQGDINFDLKSISALFNIDRLKVPVMLVHGDKDSTVPIKQSRLYADALKAAGKPYEYYSLANEGHGLSTAANAQIWYDRLDAFLAKYNPAD